MCIRDRATALLQNSAPVVNLFNTQQVALLLGVAYRHITVATLKSLWALDKLHVVIEAGKAAQAVQAQVLQMPQLPKEYDDLMAKHLPKVYVESSTNTATYATCGTRPDLPFTAEAATGPERAMPMSDVGLNAPGSKAMQAGVAVAGVPVRSVRSILADGWRDDADMGEVLWALGEVLGEGFLVRLPQPGRMSAMHI